MKSKKALLTTLGVLTGVAGIGAVAALSILLAKNNNAKSKEQANETNTLKLKKLIIEANDELQRHIVVTASQIEQKDLNNQFSQAINVAENVLINTKDEAKIKEALDALNTAYTNYVKGIAKIKGDEIKSRLFAELQAKIASALNNFENEEIKNEPEAEKQYQSLLEFSNSSDANQLPNENIQSKLAKIEKMQAALDNFNNSIKEINNQKNALVNTYDTKYNFLVNDLIGSILTKEIYADVLAEANEFKDSLTKLTRTENTIAQYQEEIAKIEAKITKLTEEVRAIDEKEAQRIELLNSLKSIVSNVETLMHDYEIPEATDPKDQVVVEILAKLNEGVEDAKSVYESKNNDDISTRLRLLTALYEEKKTALETNKASITTKKSELTNSVTQANELIQNNENEDDAEMKTKIDALKEKIQEAEAAVANQYISLETATSTMEALTEKLNDLNQYVENYNNKKSLIESVKTQLTPLKTTSETINSDAESLNNLPEGDAKNKYDQEVSPKITQLNEKLTSLEELANKKPSEIEDTYQNDSNTLITEISNLETEIQSAIEEVKRLKSESETSESETNDREQLLNALKATVAKTQSLIAEYQIPEDTDNKDQFVVDSLTRLQEGVTDAESVYNSEDNDQISTRERLLNSLYEEEKSALEQNKANIQSKKDELNTLITESEELVNRYNNPSEEDEGFRARVQDFNNRIQEAKTAKDNQYISLNDVEASLTSLDSAKREFDQYVQKYETNKRLIDEAKSKYSQLESEKHQINGRILSLGEDLKEGGSAKAKYEELQNKYQEFDNEISNLLNLSTQKPSEISDSYQDEVNSAENNINAKKSEIESLINEVEQLKQQEAEQPTDNSEETPSN
ncbi:hypothetical protein ACUZ9N_02680 [Mycoplasmopsis gallinarum]